MRRPVTFAATISTQCWGDGSHRTVRTAARRSRRFGARDLGRLAGDQDAPAAPVSVVLSVHLECDERPLGGRVELDACIARKRAPVKKLVVHVVDREDLGVAVHQHRRAGRALRYGDVPGIRRRSGARATSSSDLPCPVRSCVRRCTSSVVVAAPTERSQGRSLAGAGRRPARRHEHATRTARHAHRTLGSPNPEDDRFVVRVGLPSNRATRSTGASSDMWTCPHSPQRRRPSGVTEKSASYPDARSSATTSTTLPSATATTVRAGFLREGRRASPRVPTQSRAVRWRPAVLPSDSRAGPGRGRGRPRRRRRAGCPRVPGTSQ